MRLLIAKYLLIFTSKIVNDRYPWVATSINTVLVEVEKIITVQKKWKNNAR